MSLISQKSAYGPPKVGGDTLSYCTRCKMELGHVIVSMMDGQPAQVICNTCKSQHRFRRQTTLSRSPSKRTSKKVTKQVIPVSEIWEKKMSERTKDEIQDYKPTDEYKSGQIVKHTKFGIGFVEVIKTPTKISVLFRDGERVLVQGHK